MGGKLRLLGLAALVAALSLVGSSRLLSTPEKAEAAAAYNVNVISQSCTGDGYVRINLAWGAPMEGAQWVDLSLSNNGFFPGTFIGIGPFGAYDGTGTWSGLQPGLTHFLRINTVNQFGYWTPSQTINFVTRGDCGGFIAYQPPLLQFNPNVLSQQCLPDGRVSVSFNWFLTPVTAGATTPSAMYADLSIVDNRFMPGSFIGYGEVLPSQQQLMWNGLLPGRVHFFRLNGFGPYGWMPSQPISFTTIAC
jgi:hypothetical protein